MSIGEIWRHGLFLAALIWILVTIPSANSQSASASVTSAESITIQADELNEQGRFTAAEPLYRKALEMQLSMVGETHLETAQAYDNLGSNLSQQGRYAEANVLLRKSLEIVRSNLGEADGGVAASYNNLAANLFAWGRYKEAEPFYRRALEINRSTLGEDHPNTATSYTNLAANLVRQGRRAEADKLNRQAPLDEHSPNTKVRLTVAARYNSTGYSLFSQRRYSEAEPYYRKALEINRTVLGETHPDTAMSYINLASTLSGLGGFAEAEPLYRRALESNLAALGESHPFTARGLSNLATNLNLQGRYAEAEILSAKAVETARRATQAGLGTAESDQSSIDIGRPFHDLFGDYLGIAWNLSAANPAERDRLSASAFRVAQDAMKSTSAVAMAQAAVRTAAGSDELARAAREEQDLTALVADLDKKLLAALSKRSIADETRLKTQYDGAVTRLAAAGARINENFPAYRELVSTQPLELAEVQRALEPDEGLLVLTMSGEGIFSFAVTPKSVAWNWIDPAGTKQVLDRIITLRCEVDWKTCPAEEQYRLDLIPFTPFEEKLFRRYDLDLAYGLYQALIAPTASALRGAKRLYVTSSGPLGDLPLGMLTDAPPPPDADFADPAVLLRAQWFADRYPMTALPAVSALRLKALRKAGQFASTTFRGYGDPRLDGTNLPDGSYGFFQGGTGNSALADPGQLRQLPPLPGTHAELSAMADLFGKGEDSLRLGNSATESVLRRDELLSTADIIAFATHGLLPSRKFKLDEPGLVFTPPVTPSAEDDGILTASEASALSLTADWVILSACNTASTANGAGGNDNLSALSRGFLYAGANALLASHWRVSDEATAALTVETISARRANPQTTRARALQMAMHSIRTGLRRDGTPVHGWSQEWVHPVAWAAFTHIANQDQ